LALVEKINRDIVEGLRQPQLKEKLQRMMLADRHAGRCRKILCRGNGVVGEVITENNVKVE
jgi:hypothetical protein